MNRGPASSLPSHTAELEVGAILQGAYRLERLLGSGGTGAVYEAAEVGGGRRVALKILWAKYAKDESVVSRFAREARAASAVESEHIVRILDSGSHEGRPFLVMELLTGEDLGTKLRRTHRLALDETLQITRQLLVGLAAAHAAGIVHRDLKPDNVLLVQGPGCFAKILDFGTSKIQPLSGRTTPLSITRGGVAVGTPFYMSPEQAQARGDVDERSDLYSVGAIAFECLTGRPPHVGETDDEIVASLCTRDAPKVASVAPEIPATVGSFIDRALVRDRGMRFLSARSMLDALEGATASLQAADATPNRGGTANRTSRKRARAAISGWTWVAAFLAALCGSALTAWVFGSLRDRGNEGAASSQAHASAGVDVHADAALE